MIALQPSNNAPALNNRRWMFTGQWAFAVLAFLLLQSFANLSELSATALNDIAWWLACGTALYLSIRVARRVSGREQVAWWLFAAGFGSWLFAHSVWTTYELALGGLPPFPHWMQFFFSAYDWLFVAALLMLPKPVGASQFTPRHAGNLVLIACALLVAFVVALYEPAMIPGRAPGSTAMVLLHCVGLASMFVIALYLLWSYSWQALYWPLVLMVLGAGIHTVTYVSFAHQMMTNAYVANAWFNASWLFVFGCYACAANDRLRRTYFAMPYDRKRLMQRDRWLEALIPALLITVMIAMTWGYNQWLTLRVAAIASIGGIIFAAALGLREIWIQQQEQRLIAALHDSNENMITANRDLAASEGRYRDLSTQLEQHVQDRTVELQRAYRELENFSYAVAHDLKAPLRALDGYGAILTEEIGHRLEGKASDYLQRIRRSALKMSELIDDLLAYARAERREYQIGELSVTELIQSVVAEQHEDIERYGAKVELDLQASTAKADREGLVMVCRNLLQNALKFSQHAKPPLVRIVVTQDHALVRIAVEDNGLGFDMIHHDKIFEIFQRLHRADEIPGTGIGLAIVRKAVERMHGRVWATSKRGEGAIFYVQLPAA